MDELSVLFPEYGATPGRDCCLHIMIRVPPMERAASLKEKLSALPDATVALYPEAKEILLSVLVASPSDPDILLREVKLLIAWFNREKKDMDGAEILETKLVDSSISETVLGKWKLSERFYAVLDGESTDGQSDSCLVLDPGRVFGSGFHPSTRLALRALEEWAAETDNLLKIDALDIGTGSGVLALVCGKLGVGSVLAIDVSRESIAVATKNIKSNGLDKKILAVDSPLAEITDRFDLVLANLTPSVLTRNLEDIIKRLRDQGTLIVSGQQGRQAEGIGQMFMGKGFTKPVLYSEEQWRAIRLRFTGNMS